MDKEEAEKVLQLAKSGDAEAQFDLGWLYKNGPASFKIGEIEIGGTLEFSKVILSPSNGS